MVCCFCVYYSCLFPVVAVTTFWASSCALCSYFVFCTQWVEDNARCCSSAGVGENVAGLFLRLLRQRALRHVPPMPVVVPDFDRRGDSFAPSVYVALSLRLRLCISLCVLFCVCLAPATLFVSYLFFFFLLLLSFIFSPLFFLFERFFLDHSVFVFIPCPCFCVCFFLFLYFSPPLFLSFLLAWFVLGTGGPRLCRYPRGSHQHQSFRKPLALCLRDVQLRPHGMTPII